jgi:hypothetical protein
MLLPLNPGLSARRSDRASASALALSGDGINGADVTMFDGTVYRFHATTLILTFQVAIDAITLV